MVLVSNRVEYLALAPYLYRIRPLMSSLFSLVDSLYLAESQHSLRNRLRFVLSREMGGSIT